MKLEDKIQKEIAKLHLNEDEAMSILKTLRKTSERKIGSYNHHFSNKHVKFMVISDSHIGNKAFDEELLFKAFAYAKREGVEAIYHAGDITDGTNMRDGQIYELEKHLIGFSNQVSYTKELFDKSPVKIYGILGNHDQAYMKKSNGGADIGKELQGCCKNFINLGFDEADIRFSDKVNMKLIHPNDGTAYAPGYKLMKMIESFGGNEKPSIMFQGHYHKSLYMFSRNIHSYEAGTICGQTPFMRLKKLAAHKGFWIVDMFMDKRGIEKIVNQFVPAYE
jgi:predicted phosphodiesterase